jgi:hypothetical protein
MVGNGMEGTIEIYWCLSAIRGGRDFRAAREKKQQSSERQLCRFLITIPASS